MVRHLPVFTRYEWFDRDGSSGPGAGELLAAPGRVSVITVGANWFFRGHALKLSFDVGYALDPITAGLACPTSGYLADASPSDPQDNPRAGQLVIRTQMQLLF